MPPRRSPHPASRQWWGPQTLTRLSSRLAILPTPRCQRRQFPWLNSVDFYISFDNNIKGELFVGGDNDALKPVEGAELEIPLELEDESAPSVAF